METMTTKLTTAQQTMLVRGTLAVISGDKSVRFKGPDGGVWLRLKKLGLVGYNPNDGGYIITEEGQRAVAGLLAYGQLVDAFKLWRGRDVTKDVDAQIRAARERALHTSYRLGQAADMVYHGERLSATEISAMVEAINGALDEEKALTDTRKYMLQGLPEVTIHDVRARLAMAGMSVLWDHFMEMANA